MNKNPTLKQKQELCDQFCAKIKTHYPKLRTESKVAWYRANEMWRSPVDDAVARFLKTMT